MVVRKYDLHFTRAIDSTTYLHVAWRQPDLDSTCAFSLIFYWFVGISASPVLLMPVCGTDIWHRVLFFKKTEILHAYAYFFGSRYFFLTLETHDFHKQIFVLILTFWIRYFGIKVPRKCWSRMSCMLLLSPGTTPVIWPSCTIMAWSFSIAELCDWQQRELQIQPDSFPCRSAIVFHMLKNSFQYHLNAFWV